MALALALAFSPALMVTHALALTPDGEIITSFTVKVVDASGSPVEGVTPLFEAYKASNGDRVYGYDVPTDQPGTESADAWSKTDANGEATFDLSDADTTPFVSGIGDCEDPIYYKVGVVGDEYTCDTPKKLALALDNDVTWSYELYAKEVDDEEFTGDPIVLTVSKAAETVDVNAPWAAADFTYGTWTSEGLDIFKAEDTGDRLDVTVDVVTGFSESGQAKLEAGKTDLVIPATNAEGKQVCGVGKDAFKSKGLTSITFPEGVKTENDKKSWNPDLAERGNFWIGSSAFARNDKLTEVVLPEGVIYAGVSAFDFCSGIAKVTLPKTLTWIGNTAFRGNGTSSANGALKEISCADEQDFFLSIGEMAFANQSLTEVDMPTNLSFLSANTFFWNPGAEPITENVAGATATAFNNQKTHKATKEANGIVYIYVTDMSRIGTFAKQRTVTGKGSNVQEIKQKDEPAAPSITKAVALSDGRTGAEYTINVPEGQQGKDVVFAIEGVGSITKTVSAAGETTFQVPVAPKNLPDTMTIKYDGADITGDYTSVQAVLETQGGDFATGMGEYGKAAANYLLKKSNTLLDTTTGATLPDYGTKDTNGSVGGLTDTGYSLVHNSKLYYKQYFKLTGDVSDYTATLNGEKAELVKSGSEYYVKVPAVALNDWAKAQTVTVSKGEEGIGNEPESYSVTFSATIYAQGKVNATKEALQNLAKAMHVYYQTTQNNEGDRS